MDENLIDDIFSVLETAKKAHDLLPQCPPNIKPVHFRILSAMYRIKDSNGNARITDINKAVNFLLPNTTRFVNELVALKVVEKIQSPDDKRAVLVHPTPLGEQYIETHIANYHRLLITEFSTINSSDLEAMNRAINSIYEIMKKIYKNN